jgi:hypothetical protein
MYTSPIANQRVALNTDQRNFDFAPVKQDGLSPSRQFTGQQLAEKSPGPIREFSVLYQNAEEIRQSCEYPTPSNMGPPSKRNLQLPTSVRRSSRIRNMAHFSPVTKFRMDDFDMEIIESFGQTGQGHPLNQGKTSGLKALSEQKAKVWYGSPERVINDAQTIESSEKHLRAPVKGNCTQFHDQNDFIAWKPSNSEISMEVGQLNLDEREIPEGTFESPRCISKEKDNLPQDTVADQSTNFTLRQKSF